MGKGIAVDHKAMTNIQHLKVLTLQHNRIASGVELSYYDDTTIGNKNNECSWGLCLDSKEIYPDVDMHIFPEHFTEYDRIAPKHRELEQKCPLDTGKTPKQFTSCGCFYRCAVFQSRGKPKLTREQVLDLYCIEIKKYVDKLKSTP